MFSVGIIGLPNVGKSTLFKAITKIAVPIANYPFTTIDPHHGIVEVKDERLKKLKEILLPKKVQAPVIEFIDIAGLVKNAHKGEGLGNQFLSNISEADILLEVIRCFSINAEPKKEKKDDISYQLWEKPDPKRDIEILHTEITKRDKKILENFFQEEKKKLIIKKNSEDEIKSIEILIERLEKNQIPIKEENFDQKERKIIKEVGKKMGLISLKPIIYCFNVKEKGDVPKEFLEEFQPSILLNIKEEEEISELSEKEKEELQVKSSLDDLILNCYNTLDLITFYTIKGGEEIRGCEIKRGSNILDAAEKIHSDFKEKFICAEVISFEDFINCGSWHTAKEKGLIKIKGKDYIVEDGDIIEFKI